MGIVKGLLGLLCFAAAATGSYYYFHQQQEREREEKLYAQLDTLTDPKFFQQFLVDFPESSHCEEVKQRMKSLVKENQDWESVLSSISHSSITLFLEQYPQSHRRYLCENMLDSIDWAKAVQEETPEAIDTYLSLHPEGEHVKDRDERMGMCLDIGHNLRYGSDSLADYIRYHKRVFDMHLKDVTAPTKAGQRAEVGRGIIDFPRFIKLLRKYHYTGAVSLEHEKDMKNPFMGIAESIGFFRGVCQATR